MFHIVQKVRYLSGYKLALLFNDGKTKIVDFEQRLKNAKNMFEPLKDISYFKKVRTDGITIVWPNGLDLCPDVLYEIGEEMEIKKKKIQKSRSIRRAKSSAPSKGKVGSYSTNPCG